MHIETTTVRSILTRTCGYLRGIASHSLQPYAGCSFGGLLCGVGCYVRHNFYVTRGRRWGAFLEVRTNAREVYLRTAAKERLWARRKHGAFTVFLSSSTEPFPPQEARFGITRAVLEAMCEEPPDGLILQTHSHTVVEQLPCLDRLREKTDLRVHLSIETDRDGLPGLPPHGSPVEARFRAARTLKEAGFHVVITVAPLLPIGDPEGFFARVADAASAVVIDHFIQGDGTPGGSGARTLRTRLPEAMAAVDPDSVHLEYRERMVAVARRFLPGCVGVGRDGFAGRYLP